MDMALRRSYSSAESQVPSGSLALEEGSQVPSGSLELQEGSQVPSGSMALEEDSQVPYGSPELQEYQPVVIVDREEEREQEDDTEQYTPAEKVQMLKDLCLTIAANMVELQNQKFCQEYRQACDKFITEATIAAWTLASTQDTPEEIAICLPASASSGLS